MGFPEARSPGCHLPVWVSAPGVPGGGAAAAGTHTYASLCLLLRPHVGQNRYHGVRPRGPRAGGWLVRPHCDDPPPTVTWYPRSPSCTEAPGTCPSPLACAPKGRGTGVAAPCHIAAIGTRFHRPLWGPGESTWPPGTLGGQTGEVAERLGAPGRPGTRLLAAPGPCPAAHLLAGGSPLGLDSSGGFTSQPLFVISCCWAGGRGRRGAGSAACEGPCARGATWTSLFLSGRV